MVGIIMIQASVTLLTLKGSFYNMKTYLKLPVWNSEISLHKLPKSKLSAMKDSIKSRCTTIRLLVDYKRWS